VKKALSSLKNAKRIRMHLLAGPSALHAIQKLKMVRNDARQPEVAVTNNDKTKVPITCTTMEMLIQH